VVLSKAHEVVEPGYSWLTGAAAKVTDRGQNLGNSSRVSTEQRYPSRVNQNSSADQ
jgi:hypothetical protein